MDIPEQKNANTGGSPYIKALSVVGITTGFIFGPMALFGGIGWWLTKQYNNNLFVIIAVLLALVVSNILIFRTTETVLKKIGKQP